jgi:Tripartite tricarboxylate transporter family receptor
VRAPADGYTLFMANTVNAINATLYENLNYNFITDMAPIALLVRSALLMQVNPSVPARTVPEFIAYAKANPGTINMGSGGNGATGHVSGELFKMMAGVKLVHVPYRGEALALTDLIAGQVQIVFATVGSSIQYIRAGQLRALAITSATRSEALPEVPPLADFLPGYEASSWNGLCAPRIRPPKSSTGSTRKSTRRSPIQRLRRALSTWAGRRSEARPPTLQGSLPKIPRGGRRSSSSRAPNRTDRRRRSMIGAPSARFAAFTPPHPARCSASFAADP